MAMHGKSFIYANSVPVYTPTRMCTSTFISTTCSSLSVLDDHCMMQYVICTSQRGNAWEVLHVCRRVSCAVVHNHSYVIYTSEFICDIF